jgi:diguanylate cyclase (GGDEF)-like protein
VLRTGEGVLVRDRLEERSLLILGDEEEGITRSGISAPLRLKGRLLGAISTQSLEPYAFDEADLELLQGIADLAAVAVANARYVAALERKTREAEEVEAIGRALTASLDPRKVLGKVAEAVIDLVEEADGAAVWLMEPGMVVRVETSAGEVRLPSGSEWSLKGTELEGLVRSAEGVVVEDLSDYPLVPEDLRDHLSGGSGLAVPLVVGDEVAGVLSCGSKRKGALRGDHLGVVARLASQASVALENARLHASVQSLSLTDPLTGLPNRRQLKIHLDREVAAARRGRSLEAVLFDLDNFKNYNDTYGHLAGDDALRAFAQILAEENRAMNLVARYGGDEFISILSDSVPPGAAHYLERIRYRVGEDPILSPAGVTVSCGVAAFDAHTMRTGEELVHAADHDLYAQKGGRR